MSTSGSSIVLDAIWSDEHTANTGLGLTLALDSSVISGTTRANTTETMEVQFLNLGARISTAEYGSDQFIKIQTFEGGIFTDYEDAANYDSAKLLERNTTYERRGQDATITVNGQQMKTNGLTLDLATPDIMADVVFNSGKSGTTTLAQVGYNEGTIFTKATSLTLAYDGESADAGSGKAYNARFTGLLNNAGHVTNEIISNFQGGMQLQLGESSGDQERTVIALKSMSTAQLGRIEVTKQFDPKKAVIETKTLSIQDVMGGQLASLSTDPTLAMKIIEKAIADVSEQRATIGAVQANMLQTNENNLRVAIENITKTESNIRDTDMASEMTEFTKSQVLAQAGISMVSQANAQSQSVLSLLQ
jgi:flagellin-like hook-associated protein FlgL